MVIKIMLVVWVVCAPFNYGLTLADFWKEFPRLQRFPGRWNELVWRARIAALAGPFPIVYLGLSTRYRYGMMFRRPRSTPEGAE